MKKLKILLRLINFLILKLVSSKENINVEKVFEFFTYKLISYYEKNEEEYQGDSNQRRLSKAQVINTIREKKKCDCEILIF